VIIAMYGKEKHEVKLTELLIEAATNQACAAIELKIKMKITRNISNTSFKNIF